MSPAGSIRYNGKELESIKPKEQLMEIIGETGCDFFKENMEALPEPKQASTTIATILKDAE